MFVELDTGTIIQAGIHTGWSSEDRAGECHLLPVWSFIRKCQVYKCRLIDGVLVLE